MTTTLAAPAEFDTYNTSALREALAEAVTGGDHRVVVDLSAVDYLDAAGLGVLMGALTRAVAHDGWVRLAAPTDRILRTLEAIGLARVFGVFGTVEAANGGTR